VTTPKSWTPERIAELRRLAELGFSAIKIAQMMNTTNAAISFACFKHGIKTRRSGRQKSNPVNLGGPDWSRRQK